MWERLLNILSPRVCFHGWEVADIFGRRVTLSCRRCGATRRYDLPREG